ncbi:GntR family transcriptional regulator [Georgenia faecalis]|uniref:GntR family transcriptional regulator n=1 Tax=Georgenia faecalis TaxID=2483799 RepID=A0ABV9DAB7_9MICO|nr:GntR family transcriptional regulator [Georgenia faecalis]
MPEQPQITVDRSSPVPLYHQVAQAIEAAILNGTFAAGARLENEVSLAARLGISRPTARQALQSLVDRGLLVRRRGVGTQVAQSRIRRAMELTSLHDDLAGTGRAPQTQLLAYITAPAEASVSEALGLAPGTEVVTVRRLRFADGAPLALMTNHLPVGLCPGEEVLRTQGLYEALRAQGVRLHAARQRIGARLARAAEARVLGEPPRSALLTMERTAFDPAGTAVEYGNHVYRASRYMFDTTLLAR